ncbi:MAG: hypothetical protein ACREQA_24365, partial [Candidatus Binatia bacterium]
CYVFRNLPGGKSGQCAVVARFRKFLLFVLAERMTSRLPVAGSALVAIRRGGAERTIKVRTAELPPTPPRSPR